MLIGWILLALAITLAVWSIATYNGLITSNNRTDEAWADIDVQLKRRYDLIPNLIETVKGYATHESGTFQKISEARAMAMGAKTVTERNQAENALAQTLKSLFAVSEAYPELKANQNFLSLQAELTDTENKIQAARRFYNGNVRDLNIKLQVFPSNLIANLLGFRKRDFFEIGDASERAVPQVTF